MRIFISCSASSLQTVSAVSAALAERGHELLPVGPLRHGGEVYGGISEIIRKADVVVAVLTDQNPKVHYEIGYAYGLGKPLLLMALSGLSVPTDLVAVPYVEMTGEVDIDVRAVAAALDSLSVNAGFGTEHKLDRYRLARSFLDEMPSHEFGHLVSEWFTSNGCLPADRHGDADHGVDLVLSSPDRRQVAVVEMKKLHRQSRVSVEAVRELIGAVAAAEATVGLLISTADFTMAAHALAATARDIHLLTLNDLFDEDSDRLDYWIRDFCHGNHEVHFADVIARRSTSWFSADGFDCPLCHSQKENWDACEEEQDTH